MIVQEDRVSSKKWELPPIATTRSGVNFDPHLEVWAFRDGVYSVSMNFGQIPATSEEFIRSMKAALIWNFRLYSSRYAAGLFQSMKSLTRFISTGSEVPLEIIRFEHLANYRAFNLAIHEAHLISLSAFLKRWFSLGYPGVHKSAVKYLSEVKLRGYEKGVAVRTMDPLMGPFTHIETEGLLVALASALARRDIQIDGYVLAWLFIAFGLRPVQCAALKVCDLRLLPGGEGADNSYFLSIPRAKQGSTVCRDLFTCRPILPEIGRLIEIHCQNVKAKLSGHLVDLDAAPLFPQSRSADFSAGLEFHLSADGLGARLTGVMSALGVMSERTGEELHISPIRFRRTIGTRAAEEGLGLLVIAELLDHSDTQNVGVYAEATPAIIERIDRAIATRMAPLAQAFAGKLIRHESDAIRGSDPSSRILDLRIDQSGQAMGSCGQHSYCGFSAPIACYTCSCFEPWLDGPHEDVLDFLLEKRAQLLKTTDERVASVNDRTILAVAEVIRLCSEFRAEKVANDDD